MQIFVEKEAEEFLEKEGFKVAKRQVTKTEKEAIEAAKKLGYPVVMKVYSKKIIHKSDVGGVKTDLRNDEEARQAFQEIKQIQFCEGVLVQEFVPGDWFLVGLKKDPTFDHVVAFGSGGVYTEVFKDITFRVCPIGDKEAKEMVKEIKGYKILKGIRGKPLNINAVESVIKRVSDLSQKYKTIIELDINPLVVNEKEAKIVDVRIVFD